MSISSFCIEQHKKEQETLKKFLVYSFAGSAVLHIVLALGISLAWETRPELAEDPIEIILVEEPEVPKAEEQPLKETPKPKPTPKAVETPTPPQPTKTQIPEPIKPQQRAEALPQKPVKQPVPAIPATPQRAVTPPAPTSVEPPTEPTRERRTVVTPPSEPIREPSDPALSPPEPVAINNSAPPRPDRNSQPLQTDSDVEKLRERLSEPTTTESTAPPNDDASEANPTPPGAVATNPSAPPRPRGVSGILSDASKITENIRERLGDSFSPSTDSLSDIANPGSPGAVATNPSAPTRPSSSSQPLSGSSSGSQPFRESLGGGSSGERASSSEGDSIANPGVPGEVATNSSAPTRPKPGGDRTEDGGRVLRCISGCNPDYPNSSLKGEEGRVPVNVELDRNGNVVNARALRVETDGTRRSQFVQEAEAAARKMKFTKPEGRNSVTVTVNINFTQPGSERDRQARERREQNERERQQREQERQAQLERERQEQERQAQLERERQEQERQEQERQEQLERERQEQERQEQLERERQEQERQEQLERERQEQERQEQLERERQEQERQEQLERERQEQERQEQLERERQEQVEEVPPPEPKE
ncbi:MAG: TonB family protein [Coleofasciculus sp. G1-WW12-02]|uniref:TonB family protein n=1 Tax=Coleofasciculus sp. G1-WW12-02 TaxID=3068483 RepID=UPI0032F17453